MSDEDFITIAGAARLLGKSPSTVRKMIRDRRLTAYGDGERQWVDRRQVLAVRDGRG